MPLESGGRLSPLPDYDTKWSYAGLKTLDDLNPYEKPDGFGGVLSSGYYGVNTGLDTPSEHVRLADRPNAGGIGGGEAPYSGNRSWGQDAPSEHAWRPSDVASGKPNTASTQSHDERAEALAKAERQVSHSLEARDERAEGFAKAERQASHSLEARDERSDAVTKAERQLAASHGARDERAEAAAKAKQASLSLEARDERSSASRSHTSSSPSALKDDGYGSAGSVARARAVDRQSTPGYAGDSIPLESSGEVGGEQSSSIKPVLIDLRKTIITCVSCFRSMNYKTLRFRMISISYLFFLLMFSLLPFSVTTAHAECISDTRLDVSVELIISSIQNASDIDHISKLIKQINTETPLFCEQEKIKSSGLVFNISVLNFFEKEIFIYQIVGKWAILTLNFDYKSGMFLPEYSGIRTKKTVGDYQLAPL